MHIKKQLAYEVKRLGIFKELAYAIKKKDPPKTRYMKEVFLDTFRRSMGIVKLGCTAAGIARRTFYLWYETDAEFRREIDTIRREQMGDVEDRLFLAIANNEPWAIRLFLTHVHPKYRPKVEQYNVQPQKTLEDVLNEYHRQNDRKTENTVKDISTESLSNIENQE